MASSPITSWQNGEIFNGENVETVTDFIFLGSKITVNSDCSHKIKRHLLLGRKVMTNLDSLLKNRDIILPMNVHILKVIIFPVFMYECESWIVMKAEHQRFDALKLWFLRRLLGVPWTKRGSNQSILKQINLEYSLQGLIMKLQLFGHRMQRVGSLENTLMLGKIEGKGEGGSRG